MFTDLTQHETPPPSPGALSGKGHGGAAPRSRPRRGSVLLMSLTFMILFASLAAGMAAYSMSNMQIQDAETDANRALAAAESGLAYLNMQFRTVSLPAIKEGNIGAMTSPPASALWSGTNIESLGSSNVGVAVALTNAFNNSGAFSGSPTIIAPSGTASLTTPFAPVDSNGDGSTYSLTISWDSANPQVPAGSSLTTASEAAVLHCTSSGKSGAVTRQVTMDVWIQKTLKYAVYSNVAIQLGKNVRVVGDIASTYAGTNKGPPIQMFSDFHYLPNETGIDNDLATFRGLLNSYDTSFTNRLDVRNASSSAATAAAAAGLYDANGDGFIDDYDVALMHLDTDWSRTTPWANNITTADYTNPNTGKAYDPDLWTVIDDPMGASHAPLWTGYDDGVINNSDGYAKVIGTVKTALTNAQWESAAAGWSAWGDTSGGTSGTSSRDQFEGSVVSSDPTASAVQFGANFANDQTLQPSNFSTTAYDNLIPTTTAVKTTPGGVTTIQNGNLTAAMANGGTTTEHSPSDVTSGWEATYSRPVFQNINFNNVRIPKGLNAKFINCTFNGYTSVKLTTNITSGGQTTTDPSAGNTWAQQMTSGSFSPNTTLTDSNSTGAAQGNNLHFTGCTFNGVLTADVPTAYTHFADSLEFDGATTFNNTVDQSVTIMAPNTNIEMGSYVDPAGSPSTLVGVVVAGNLDIRGSASVDGSVLVTGAGATNTTLGYFGTTDSGQPVPNPSQLPAAANGYYGHLFFRSNPSRGMPTGITIPVVAYPQVSTYRILN